MKQYKQPKIEMILNDMSEDIITTSGLLDEVLRLIPNGNGNTWDVSSTPRE